MFFKAWNCQFHYTNNIKELKESDGFHYTAEGKIVVLDAYEWETGLQLPIMSSK